MLTMSQIMDVLRFKQSLQRVRDARALGFCPFRDCKCNKPHFKDSPKEGHQEATCQV